MSKLFVVGIPRDMESAELVEIFSDYGEVQLATVVTDIDTGISKGYAFITMSDAEGAEAAIKALDGATIDDRTVSVRLAKQSIMPKAEKFEKPSGIPLKGTSPGERKGKRPRIGR